MNLEEARKLSYIENGHTLENGYYHSGDIIGCPKCGGYVQKTNFQREECHGMLVDAEYDYQCSECLEKLGHYAYGSYHYYFIKESKKICSG